MTNQPWTWPMWSWILVLDIQDWPHYLRHNMLLYNEVGQMGDKISLAFFRNLVFQGVYKAMAFHLSHPSYSFNLHTYGLALLLLELSISIFLKLSPLSFLSIFSSTYTQFSLSPCDQLVVNFVASVDQFQSYNHSYVLTFFYLASCLIFNPLSFYSIPSVMFPDNHTTIMVV